MGSCQTGPGQLSPYQINLPAKQFNVSHLHCFLTAAWLWGGDNPRETTVLSHAKRNWLFTQTEGGLGWGSAETQLSLLLPAYQWPWGSREEVVTTQLPYCCYHWQTPYHLCVWATGRLCVCLCLLACLHLCTLAYSSRRGDDFYCVPVSLQSHNYWVQTEGTGQSWPSPAQQQEKKSEAVRSSVRAMDWRLDIWNWWTLEDHLITTLSDNDCDLHPPPPPKTKCFYFSPSANEAVQTGDDFIWTLICSLLHPRWQIQEPVCVN